MSAPQTSHDPENHASFIKTPQQLITIVVLAFVVPIVLIILMAKAVVSGRAPAPGAMAPEAVAARIKPVADVAIAAQSAAAGASLKEPAEKAAAPAAPAQPAPAAAAPAPEPKPVQAAAAAPAAAPTPAPAASGGKGKEVYDKACTVCHATGVANAPKLGDKAAWAPRIKTGVDALYASSITGKGAMPPKGGQVQIADADIKAAVDYMVAAAK